MVRIHDEVKTAAYEGLKWSFFDSDFCLKLPNTKAAAPAIAFLKKCKEPMAVYMDRTGRRIAFQWRLSKREYRALWTSPRIKEIEG